MTEHEKKQAVAINRMVRQILEMAQRENIDSVVLVAALSDAIGYVAVQLDQMGGTQPIDSRLVPVVQRIRETYGRVSSVHGLSMRRNGHGE